MAIGRNKIIAALDLGTTKACCLIARVEADDQIRVIGIGHRASEGIKAGAVVNMETAEETIRSAVGAAERMSGETIQDVVLSLSGGSPTSHTVGVEVAINGHEVDDNDIRHVLDQARGRYEAGEREVVHAVPVGYTIDGASGISDPRGLFGERLGVNVHVITAAAGPMRNLTACAKRGHLDISAMVVSPFASALACLVKDEMDLGVTCIDMGGGTTSVAVVVGGSVVYTDVIPVGGLHVTNDIARGLSTPAAEAERLKTLYGCAIAGPSDDRATIVVPQVGEPEQEIAGQVPRSVLTGIILPRLEETFELVRDSLETSGFRRVAGRRVVLTGGASQLPGVRELAARILERQIRMGRPIRVVGLAEATSGPAFSTCTGMLNYALRNSDEELHEREEQQGPPQGRLARVGRWLKENF